MDSLRRRIPFQYVSDDADENVSEVLDEQQQEALIDSLRAENTRTNELYTLFLRGALGISGLSLLFSFTNHNAQRIPYPFVFTMLALTINANLFVLLVPSWKRKLADLELPLPFSYSTSYMLSFVPPTLCLFLKNGIWWPTVGWWCIPALMVFITHTICDAMEQGEHGISELEASRYRAPGA